MTPKSHVVAGAILLVGIAGITGCEDAAKKSVAHAAVPGSSIMALKQGAPATRVVGTGATEKNTSAPPQLPPLAVFAPKRQTLLMLPPAQRGSKEELIARSEERRVGKEFSYRW